MSEALSTFDFGRYGICKPDQDGLYRGDYFYDSGDGITEIEALRQWLVANLENSDHMSKANRLADLAFEAAKTSGQ